MLTLDEMQARGHQSLTMLRHGPSGLRAALAVHSTVLGPAISGVRLRELDEDKAVVSALSLSESLTLKAALAGLNYGGGACVLMMPEDGIEDPHAREALFRSLGRRVGHWQQIVLTEDIGVTATDIAFMSQETSATLGMNTDTSSITGYGVYRGMKAAARLALGTESMRGVRIAILGVGAVGHALATHLHREGAKLTIADVRYEQTERLLDDLDGVESVDPSQILDTPCDIFAPCGFDHSIPSEDVSRLQCRLIAGGEHHPLTRRGEAAVQEAGIMYIPDFAINAGGLIAAALNLDADAAAEKVYQIVSQIIYTAEKHEKHPHLVARQMAERRLDLIGNLGHQ